MMLHLTAESCPGLAPGVRLNFDRARQCWVLLAPERVLMPDDTALEILQRCNGTTSLAAIVDDLVQSYSADRAEIEQDVRELLTGLAEKKIVVI